MGPDSNDTHSETQRGKEVEDTMEVDTSDVATSQGMSRATRRLGSRSGTSHGTQETSQSYDFSAFSLQIHENHLPFEINTRVVMCFSSYRKQGSERTMG